MDHDYTTGDRGLDELIGGLEQHTMLLVVGHPGAGKTTLASQVCYFNALRGKKCLYISFYEDKEKLYRNMGRIGIALKEVEERGLFEFARLPVASTEELLGTITDMLVKGNYEVVVVDSINPLLELVQREREQRAILLNFFYQLIGVVKGVLVTVAELPIGKETLDLGAVEFVADAVIYLKHRVEHGLLTRVMEVRKVRGSPLSVVEVPFSITKERGIKVYTPPKPGRIVTGVEKPLRSTLTLTSQLLLSVRMGDIVYISYPPNARVPETAIPLIDLALTNDLKVLFITFTYSLDELRTILVNMLERHLKMEPELAYRVLNKYFHIVPFNPAAHSLTYMNAQIIELIESLDPDIVAIHGGEFFSAITEKPSEFWVHHRNLVTWLKNRGKLIIRYCSRVNPYWYKMHESISDIVVRAHYKREGSTFKPVFYVWKSGLPPAIVELLPEVLEKEARKLVEVARSKSG